MKKIFWVFIPVLLSFGVSVPGFGFTIIELKGNMGFLGGSSYVYMGYNLPVATFAADWGVDFHFLFPKDDIKKYAKVKKGKLYVPNLPDHFGFGIGVDGSFLAVSHISGYGSTKKELDLKIYWLKFPLVFTYSIIEYATYMNFDIGVYYAFSLGGSREIVIAEGAIDENLKDIDPQMLGPDFGLHLQFTFGFGFPDEDVFKATGRIYPTVTGFFMGIFADFSLLDNIGLPAENYSRWSIGVHLGFPIFLQI